MLMFKAKRYGGGHYYSCYPLGMYEEMQEMKGQRREVAYDNMPPSRRTRGVRNHLEKDQGEASIDRRIASRSQQQDRPCG